MKLVTSIERMLKCYPDSSHIRKVSEHFPMGAKINMLDLICKIGATEALWSLRATSKREWHTKRQLALSLAYHVAQKLPGDMQRFCMDLLAETNRSLKVGDENYAAYREASEIVIEMQLTHDNETYKAALTCVNAASCVINEMLIDNATWLAAKYAEVVLGADEVKAICSRLL